MNKDFFTNFIQTEQKKDYFKKILEVLENDKKNNKIIFPPQDEIFNALKYTNFENIKVVILGQDPYHGENQAHGLSFSVKNGIKIPKSLQNIFKEVKDDLGYEIPLLGNLEKWAKSGVLLLNTILTVQKQTPGSHANIGWEIFTDKIIQTISDKKENIVFILWGKHAEKKTKLIDKNKHFIILSPHPSPFSAHKGFFKSKPFSKTNTFLKSKNIPIINWNLN